MGGKLSRNLGARPAALTTGAGVVAALVLGVLPSLWFMLEFANGHDGAGLAWITHGGRASILRSLKVCATVGACSLAIGWPLGTAIAMLRGWRRGLAGGLLAVPLLMPPFLWAVGVQGLKAWLPFRDQVWVDGFSGHVLASLVSGIPLVSVMTGTALAWISGSAVDAAQLMAGDVRLKLMLLRQTLPVAFGAAILAGSLACTDVGTGQMMGFQGAAGDIHAAFATSNGFHKASARAGITALVFLPLAAVGSLLVSRAAHGTRFRALRQTGVPPGTQLAGRATFVCLVLPMVMAGAGWVQILSSGYSGPAFRDAWLVWVESLGPTVSLVLQVALLLVLLATPLGWCLGRSKVATQTALGLGLVVGALPSSVHALGWLLVRSATGIPHGSGALAQFDMALALAARWLLIAVWFAASARRRLPTAALDALQLTAMSPLRRWVRYVLPTAGRRLVLPAFVCAFASLADVTAGALLQPPGQATYAMRLFGIMDNAPEKQVAAMCVTYLLAPGALLSLFALGQISESRRAAHPDCER